MKQLLYFTDGSLEYWRQNVFLYLHDICSLRYDGVGVWYAKAELHLIAIAVTRSTSTLQCAYKPISYT